MKFHSDVRMILVKIGGFGDWILMTPAIRALRETYPHATIDCITSGKRSQEFLEEYKFLNNIIVLDRDLIKSDPTIEYRQRLKQIINLKHLLNQKYDAVLSFTHLLPESLSFYLALTIATGAKLRIGLENDPGTFFDVKVKDEGFGAKHEAEYYMEVVEAAGAIVIDTQPFIPISHQRCCQAKSIITQSGSQRIERPLVAMHPGCHHANVARRWEPERFASVADQLYQEFGGQLLLLGGPEEEPLRKQVLQAMKSSMPRQSLSGTESQMLTSAILKQSDLFIGNDSGLMHAAAAVDTPTIGIFGPTNPRAWGPYMPKTPSRCRSVRLNLPCMPCQFIGERGGNMIGCASRYCLSQLQVEDVVDVARQLLGTTYIR